MMKTLKSYRNEREYGIHFTEFTRCLSDSNLESLSLARLSLNYLNIELLAERIRRLVEGYFSLVLFLSSRM